MKPSCESQQRKGWTVPDPFWTISLNVIYVRTNHPYRRCHARDVISHAIDLMEFEELPHRLTEDVLDRAFERCFADHAPVT